MKVNVATVIMRVVLGILFLAHGISKAQMGFGNVATWFQSMGIPGFMAYIVGTIEIVGGILLIVGLLTRYVSIAFIVILLGAIFTAKLSAGLMGNGQMAGYELDLSFIVIALYLALANNTSWSLDGLLFKKNRTTV
ncbi:putative oxidoreductase [Paenibacillus sp. SORGH_AS306]|uniref:DoxX family protein n=1 Tax=unclassified Paenibacillus TaxID=185978 RepID=UPI00278B326A|nr:MULTISPECIES: DoxX family protein [unclassified Paenibacillus]MDQ1235172.1 putative oxidoreductase [Paenibacillus sp. SORGH_AS_0306]MDR6112219.1 putative oxidoreductase [Paenibacillus sp. SORGH_AS_0338]